TFADVRSLKWTSGRSQVEARGRISDFQNPQLDGSYEANFDLQEAGAVARRTDLREGMAELKGSGHWTLGDFSSTGAIAIRDLTWQDEQFVLKKVSGGADYSVTDQEVRLSKLQGKVFGGSFSGDAQVQNWLHSVPPPKAKKGEDVAVISA